MTNYAITITSDIVCPWCYIGHARLNTAIQTHKKTHPSDTFTLTYRPFYLNPPPHTYSPSTPIPPSFPVHSYPRSDYYNAKFGAARARQVHDAMDQVTKPLGLHFKYGGMTGPSRNGHRLVWFAQRRGQDAQERVMTGLWRRYLEEEVDITKLEVLVEVGVEAGLGTAEEVKRFLESDEGGREVDEVAEAARKEGVSGVPHYVVQDLFEVGGAQEPRAFERLFERVKEVEGRKKEEEGDGVGNGVKVEGQYCTKDGCV